MRPKRSNGLKPACLRRGLNSLTVCSFDDGQSWPAAAVTRVQFGGGKVASTTWRPDSMLPHSCATNRRVQVYWFQLGSLMLMRWQLRRFCISNFAFSIAFRILHSMMWSGLSDEAFKVHGLAYGLAIAMRLPQCTVSQRKTRGGAQHVVTRFALHSIHELYIYNVLLSLHVYGVLRVCTY